MNTAIFTPLARYKTPGKADVIFGTTECLEEFQKTNALTEPVVYVIINYMRCPHVRCIDCPLDQEGSSCTEIHNLTIFPQFAIDFPELYI